MANRHPLRYPNESAAYREARDALLEAECDLRRQVETVAALRRRLPQGGPPPEDYVFVEGPADLDAGDEAREVRLSALFAPGRNSLLLYSFMFAPGAPACPMCTAFLDGLQGNGRHLAQRASLAVVARARLPQLRAFARERGWRGLRLLSSERNSYNADYLAEDGIDDQRPMMNVFRRDDTGIRHFWGSEMLFVAHDDGFHPRHVDPMWSLWNLLDLLPEGRGEAWYPQLDYPA